jgi:AraC-like DNA-binding protein
MDGSYRETDKVVKRSTDAARYQAVRSPIAGMAKDFRDRDETGTHAHARGQLIYATRGALRVQTAAATWIVPPNCAVWMPPQLEHAVTALGAVQMRTLYIAPDVAKRWLPSDARAVAVSPLLRELIVRAVDVPLDREPDATGRRVFGLILDELRDAPALPLLLPAADAEFAALCDALMRDPGAMPTIATAARRFHFSGRTFARRFFAATGMTFGAWCGRARLLAALARLGNGEAVTTVALDLGYASPSAFTAMFRRALGTPPTKYVQRPHAL